MNQDGWSSEKGGVSSLFCVVCLNVHSHRIVCTQYMCIIHPPGVLLKHSFVAESLNWLEIKETVELYTAIAVGQRARK